MSSPNEFKTVSEFCCSCHTQWITSGMLQQPSTPSQDQLLSARWVLFTKQIKEEDKEGRGRGGRKQGGGGELLGLRATALYWPFEREGLVFSPSPLLPPLRSLHTHTQLHTQAGEDHVRTRDGPGAEVHTHTWQDREEAAGRGQGQRVKTSDRLDTERQAG